MTDATTRAREVIAGWVEIDSQADEAMRDLADAGLGLYDTRTHAAVPREPDEMTIDAVRRAIFAATRYLPFPGLLFSKRDEIARAAIAALVQEQTQGGEREDV